MQNKRFLFVGSRLEVLRTMLHLKLNTTALLPHKSFVAKMIKGKHTIFRGKDELLNLINRANFDVLVSNGCPYILPVSKIQKKGQIFINIHPSLLPKFRGAHPINASILFAKKAGATCHIMNDELDGGDIIAWQEIQNDASINLALLYQLCFLAEAKAFEKAFERDFAPCKKQDEKKATYYKRSVADMTLNLDEDSDEMVLCKVRAFSQKGQMAKYHAQNQCFEICGAQVLQNAFLDELFGKCAFNEVVLRYENYLLIKRTNAFLELCIAEDSDKYINGGGGVTNLLNSTLLNSTFLNLALLNSTFLNSLNSSITQHSANPVNSILCQYPANPLNSTSKALYA